jgi:glucosyl-dolichyl phosphate glucuronosyltransferase
MLISVVTYTYNRAGILATLLESIYSQNLSSEMFEFVVVDNHSTDQTRELVNSFCSRYGNIHYFYEERLGASSARNRGWQEARGEYIAFIDDDGKAPPGWLEVAAGIIQDVKPDLFGGPVLPYYVSKKPLWFKDEYAIRQQGELARQLEIDEYLSGNNLFIRKEMLEVLNGFDEQLGHHGTSFGYGEETDLQRRVRKQFPQACIYYEPRLYNDHLVREEKFSLLWQVRAKFALGRFNYLTFSDGDHKLELRHLLGVVLMPFIIGYELTLGVLLRDRKKFSFPQNYYYEKSLDEIRIFGKLIERFRQSIRYKIQGSSFERFRK